MIDFYCKHENWRHVSALYKKPPNRKALVYPAGVEPTSAEPESAILSIELWVQFIDKDKVLNVEAEVHNISVFNDIALPFYVQFSCFFTSVF